LSWTLKTTTRAFYEAHESILLAGETRRLFLPIATALAALQ